ncbi:MAG: hypothetical protein IJW49_06360, partial [Clostridia bacterium]|nr:hypothetical protein [Clostridia bacterium]
DFLQKFLLPLQTTPFSQKLLNKQNRTSEPLNAAHSSCSVQPLTRLNGLVESFLLGARWLFLE